MSETSAAVPVPIDDDEIDLSSVRAALTRVERAEAGVERARAVVAEAQRSLAAQLREAFRPAREGRVPMPQGLVRELYWEWEGVRVRDLARAIGTSAAGVAGLAGPAVVSVRCGRCGRETEAEKRSRTAYVHAVCPACAEQQRREDDEERERLEVRTALRDLVEEWERNGELPYRYDRAW